MSLGDEILQIDPNVVYAVTFWATMVVPEQYRDENGDMVPNLFDDHEEDYPPYTRTIYGEVHIYKEVLVVINVENVIDSQDQPIELRIIPAICVVDVKPHHYRKER